jgi:hypothetical protein
MLLEWMGLPWVQNPALSLTCQVTLSQPWGLPETWFFTCETELTILTVW